MKNYYLYAGLAILGMVLFCFFLLLGRTSENKRKADPARLGILLSLCLVLGFIEGMLPDLLLPGVKLGLSNVAILLALYAYGRKEALLLGILKGLLLSFFTGTFLSMGGWMSITGTLLSVVLMILLHTLFKRFSPIGVSLVGALGHIIGQLTIASIYLGPSIWAYAPLGMLLSMATGVFVGILAIALLKKVSFFKIEERV